MPDPQPPGPGAAPPYFDGGIEVGGTTHKPPAPEARFDGFLRWAESTGAGGTWEIERDVARALAARLRQAERKAEYAWKFVGRCEVAEGKLREAEARVRELEEALEQADQCCARLPGVCFSRALLGSGEEQETA